MVGVIFARTDHLHIFAHQPLSSHKVKAGQSHVPQLFPAASHVNEAAVGRSTQTNHTNWMLCTLCAVWHLLFGTLAFKVPVSISASWGTDHILILIVCILGTSVVIFTKDIRLHICAHRPKRIPSVQVLLPEWKLLSLLPS